MSTKMIRPVLNIVQIYFINSDNASKISAKKNQICSGKLMRQLLFVMLSFSLCFQLQAGKQKQLNKAFAALREYDYFKARKLFYGVNAKKTDAAAAYGLALIFNRHDNPFFNLDSAGKYIHLSYAAFLKRPVPMAYAGYVVNAGHLLSLGDSIAAKQYQVLLPTAHLKDWEQFLKTNTLANTALRKKVYYHRDELVFQQVLKVNQSDSTTLFMRCYPMSDFYRDATVLLEREIYSECTSHQKPEEYVLFLKRYPGNLMVNEAYERLFEYYRKRASISGLKQFVQNYPKAPQWLEAWKLLFSLSVKAYTSVELQKFLDEYPAFPLKNSILKELALNNLQLYPYVKDDFMGYINDSAQNVISPQFDQAGNFCEGLAVVSKNDSVYFINKENENPFHAYYNDAYPFAYGMAAVKQQNKWFFINRQGQVVSKSYEEINELSGNLYVFKLNGKYGACNHFGQLVIDAKFDKLGDFKNNMAYFMLHGKYGFVSSKGQVYKEDFEWISDFDTTGVAMYKKDNLFGLINALGDKISEPLFDQMLKVSEKDYLVLKQNMYGFYSAEGCYVTALQYDYTKEKPVDFYYKDKKFKLLKNGEIAIMDENGKMDVNFGSFKEIEFMTNGLMPARKKQKYGYVDKKLSTAIPFKYQEAQAFRDSLAIVKLKNQYQLIHVNGKEVFVSDKPVSAFLFGYYVVGDDNKTILNKRGEVLFTNVTAIQAINNKFLLVTFVSGAQQLIK